MSGNRRFVDTNILLYAHDDSAGAKRDQARTLVEQLWEPRDGCLSVQVLQEFFVNVAREIAKPISVEAAKEMVADLSQWHAAKCKRPRQIGAYGQTVAWHHLARPFIRSARCSAEGSKRLA
jgi:predicted nucleic acid-binding protein